MKKKLLVVLLLFAVILPSLKITSVEAAGPEWKSDSKGWWLVGPDGQCVRSRWMRVGNSWYYFTADGYMDYSEYRDGCWLEKNGAWDTRYSGGHWMRDSVGWWYEDNSGWYPRNTWLWIDGKCYYFRQSGYLAINDTIQGSRVGTDGAWIMNNSASQGGQSSSANTTPRNDYSGFNGGSTVYVSSKGKIHKNSNCGGMKNYSTMTYDEAINKGYSKCGTCFK